MLLRFLPLVTGLLPIVTIHLSLLIAINADVIQACNPYIDGCTSISATGRYAPASFLFKPVMIAEAVIMIAFWLFSVPWLRSLYAAAEKPAGVGAVMAGCGSLGALSLIVYITFLGTQAPFYEFMRRFGIYLYFACTVLAQIGLAVRLGTVARSLGNPALTNIARAQLALACVPFVLGILNLLLKAILVDADQEENVIEWVFALLMHVYFVLVYLAWRHTGFRASVAVTGILRSPHQATEPITGRRT
jgi:hypothetical protein